MHDVKCSPSPVQETHCHSALLTRKLRQPRKKIVRGRSHRLFWYCTVSLASSYHKLTHDSCVVRLIDITLLHWTKWNYVKALCIACCGIFCYYTRLYYFIWTFILQHSIDCCCGRNCIMHYNATCICYLMSCNVMLCYAARSCTMLENDAIPYHVISYRRCACRCSSFIFFLSLPMKYLKRWWLEDKVHII